MKGENTLNTAACEAAETDWRDARGVARRLRWLMFVLALVATAAIVYAIYLATQSRPSEALLTGVGSAVTGGAALFVKQERDRADRRSDAALRRVREYCGEQRAHILLSEPT